MDFKLQFEFLSNEDLAILKGGNATVLFEKEQSSESGDGAKFVCCIDIGLNKNNII